MQNWPDYLLAAATAMLGWLGRTLHMQHREHESRLNRIEATCITREELDRTMRENSRQRELMHEQNQKKLTEITGDIKDLIRSVAGLEGKK